MLRTLFYLFIILAVFNDFFGYFFEPFSYIDDCVILVAFINVIIHIPRCRKKYFNSKKIASFYGIFLFIGGIGVTSLIVNGDFNFYRLIVGIIYFLKPILLFFLGFRIVKYSNRFNLKDVKHILEVILLIFSISVIMNVIMPSVWGDYGLKLYEGERRLVGIFTNAGRTSWMLAVLFCYVLVYLPDKINVKTIILIGILGIIIYFIYLTHVKKSLLSLLIVISAYFVTKMDKLNVRNNKKIMIFLFLLLFTLGFFTLFYDELVGRLMMEYDINGNQNENSRFLLFLGTYKILTKDLFSFLFGAGFGTWGGFASSIVYSPYYYEFGLYKVWGFIPGESTYTGDNFFAHIFGEVGIIGGFLYLYAIYIYLQALKDNIFSPLKKSYANRLNMFFYLITIQLCVELLGICAIEISTIAIVVFLLAGMNLGLKYRNNEV